MAVKLLNSFWVLFDNLTQGDTKYKTKNKKRNLSFKKYYIVVQVLQFLEFKGDLDNVT